MVGSCTCGINSLDGGVCYCPINCLGCILGSVDWAFLSSQGGGESGGGSWCRETGSGKSGPSGSGLQEKGHDEGERLGWFDS